MSPTNDQEKSPPSSLDQAKVLIADAAYDELEPVLDRVFTGLDLTNSWYAGLKGKKVFIKPNMLGLFAPEQHAATHPPLVTALVRWFRAAGAEVMVGDNCGVGSYGMNQRAAKRTGIQEAAEGAYVNVAQDTVQVPIKSRFLDHIVVSRAMMEADVLVNVPKMKTHQLTVVTGAVKNMFGLVAGASKGRAHGTAPGLKDFGAMLADIYALRPPDLNIMDAIVAMEGNGPSSGKPKPLGKILASTNALALDAVMCRIMGLPAKEVHHLAAASRKGLGPIDPADVELIGPAPAARFKLPVAVHRLSMIGRFVNQRYFAPMARTRLTLVPERCQQCKICVDGCPTGAMGWEEKRPVLDEKVCIRCFCCHELCPESAWEVRSLLGRLLMGRRS